MTSFSCARKFFLPFPLVQTPPLCYYYARRYIATQNSCREEGSALPDAQPMTEAMYYVLLGRIREISGGRLEMGPGTLYGILTRLKKEGLIELAAEDERRKTYALTESGRRALLEEYARLSRLVRDGAVLKEEET